MIDELIDAIASLGRARPVFHSETDLQQSLASYLPNAGAGFRAQREHLMSWPHRKYADIAFQSGTKMMGLETKYPTEHLHLDIDGEVFSLKKHGAADLRRYDFIKDIARMEEFQGQQPHVSAAALLITNDPHYWEGPIRKNTEDAAFSLREGRTIGGLLDWAPGAIRENKGAGRSSAIRLRGRYTARWQPYSSVPGRYGEFRFLLVAIE